MLLAEAASLQRIEPNSKDPAEALAKLRKGAH